MAEGVRPVAAGLDMEMAFDTLADAVRWLRGNGFPLATEGDVRWACWNGGLICGFRWGYE